MTESDIFEFDLTIYRLEAVKKAAYKYSGLFDIQLEMASQNRVCITFHQKDHVSSKSPELSDFPNEVLDQELRETISQETEGIRNLLLAQAFSSLTLVDPDGDNAEFGEDPLNIKPDRPAKANYRTPMDDSIP